VDTWRAQVSGCEKWARVARRTVCTGQSAAKQSSKAKQCRLCTAHSLQPHFLMDFSRPLPWAPQSPKTQSPKGKAQKAERKGRPSHKLHTNRNWKWKRREQKRAAREPLWASFGRSKAPKCGRLMQVTIRGPLSFHFAAPIWRAFGVAATCLPCLWAPQTVCGRVGCKRVASGLHKSCNWAALRAASWLQVWAKRNANRNAIEAQIYTLALRSRLGQVHANELSQNAANSFAISAPKEPHTLARRMIFALVYRQCRECLLCADKAGPKWILRALFQAFFQAPFQTPSSGHNQSGASKGLHLPDAQMEGPNGK